MSKAKNDSKSKPVTKPAKKCRAAEVGHRKCNCGGKDCGANIVTD